MISISEFMTLLSASPPRVRAGLLVVAAVSIMSMTLLYANGFKTYVAPDLSKLVSLEGRIAGYPSNWEHNRNLVHVGVSYKDQGVREGLPVYLYREQFERSGLRINSKVMLVLERLEDSVVVRELRTEDGRILSDDRHLQRVIAWNNESIRASLFFGGLAVLGFLVAALVVVLRNRGQVFAENPGCPEA